jgi:hypothetical protein
MMHERQKEWPHGERRGSSGGESQQIGQRSSSSIILFLFKSAPAAPLEPMDNHMDSRDR